MILLIGGNLSNAILSYAWVFGKWGLPAWGVAGAAWGTVVSRGVFALLGLYIITRQAAPIRLVLRRPWPRLKMLWQLFALGVPSSMQFVVRVVGFGAIQNLANRYGERDEIQAALAVGSRLDMLATFTGAGWGAASAALVGQALGAGLPARAERAGWYATFLNVLLMGGIGAAYLGWCHDLVGLWVKGEPRVQELAVGYLQVAVLGYPVAAVAVTLALSLNGAGSTKMPLFLDSLGFLGAQIPIAWWLAHHQGAHGWGRESLWWSIVGTTTFVALLYTVVWRKGHWKHKKLR
jgi:putative MATE family efflux protein